MMTAKILLEVPISELQEFQKSYYECNGYQLSLKEAKNTYIEQFFANKNDYIDCENIKVCFV